jgi:hypothetical protein
VEELMGTAKIAYNRVKKRKKKNNKWKEKPKYLKNVKYDNNYYLYVDESGNHDNKHLKRIVTHMNENSDRYLDNVDEVFSLTGILIKGTELKKLDTQVRNLKRKWFGDTHIKGKEIIIHRRSFGRNRPFLIGDKFNKKQFELEYEEIIKSINFKCFSVCSNKLISYCNGDLECDNRCTDHKIYLNSLDHLMKKINEHLVINKKKTKIVTIFESINEKNDEKVHKFLRENTLAFPFLKSVYFSPKAIKNKAVVGLELADYYSLGVFRWGLCRDYHRINIKFNNYPMHYGNGVSMI